MSVTGWTSWRATKVGAAQIEFVAKGKLITAEWRKQGLKATCTAIEGSARQEGASGYALNVATLSGGVKATVATFGNVTRTSRLSSESMTLRTSESKATLNGGVDFSTETPERFMRVTGTGAQFILYTLGQKNEFPVRSGTVSGPVSLAMRSTEPGSDGKPQPVTAKGRADRLIFDDEARTVTLIGRVTLEGSGAAFAGDVRNASKVVLKLDDKRDVIEVEASGEPGETTISREQGGTGGSTRRG